MIIGSPGKRNKDGGLGRSRNFCHCTCPRTAQNQVGTGEETWHVVDEFGDLGGQGNLAVRSLDFIIVTLSRLMNHLQASETPDQLRKSSDHGVIDSPRALTPAKDQQRG